VLERASSRGKLLICIVGLNRLRSEIFTGLKWLPLHLPPNVRVVATATSSREDVKILQDLGKVQPELRACLPLGEKVATTGAACPKLGHKSSSGEGTIRRAASNGGAGSTGLLQYPSDDCLAEIARRDWPLVGCGPWSDAEVRLAAIASMLGHSGMHAVERAAQ